MESYSLLAFLGLVALGSYIQTVTGFAIALIIIGGATALELTPIAFTANVVSFVALANVAVALHSKHMHIELKILLYSSVGVVFLSGVGLMILNHLSRNSINLLETLLGVAIIGSSVLLMIHPRPLKKVSPSYIHLIAGSLGGLLNGMFGAGGPAVVIHLYRQPLAFPVIRSTLLAILGMMLTVRIGFEAFSGNVTVPVIELSLYSVPVSIVSTIFARYFPPPVPEMAMRRFAFGLLFILGLSLILSKT